MDDPVVVIEDASITRNSRVVLRDVSLRVNRGEFVGVIGPNGSGKTTLLTLINGIIHPSSGRVETLGFRLPTPFSHRLRRRIGYVAQIENVDPRLPMTVRETALLGCAGRLGWFRRPVRAEFAALESALELTGLTRLAERPLGQISGGERQRAAIARVLVQEPELFLFDEPTASIDPRAQKDILALINGMHLEHRSTALYVTHDLHMIPQGCSRLVLMKNGRIWRDGPREKMLDSALLTELYSDVDVDSILAERA
jgi:ABC-type Mn2+/Zn2+ transport system ATPase subunit